MGLEFAALSLSKCLSNVLTKHNNQHVCVSTVCQPHRDFEKSSQTLVTQPTAKDKAVCKIRLVSVGEVLSIRDENNKAFLNLRVYRFSLNPYSFVISLCKSS